MVLKGKKPEPENKRLKMFVYGPAGVGKTVAALQFPNAYIIDAERGTESYSNIINKAGSAVMQTLNPDEIKAELKELLTTKHSYKTLIIDPVTQVYNACQEKWTKIFERNTKGSEIQDFGMRYWGKVKSDFKSIQRILLALDMNVIITAHQKDVYGAGFTKTGVTFDSMKNDDYFFDLVFQIQKKGKQRIAITIKERAEPGFQKFPDEFEWSYENFLKYYGQEIIEKESTPLALATDKDVSRLNQLIDIVRVDESTTDTWKDKAKVESFSDMTKVQIDKCIKFLEDKASPLIEEPKTDIKKGGKK